VGVLKLVSFDDRQSFGYIGGDGRESSGLTLNSIETWLSRERRRKPIHKPVSKFGERFFAFVGSDNHYKA
jgi:hypothetical protein